MSVNKIILIGNVGKEPEVKYIDSGVAVANFSLATTERGYKAANGTQVPDRTEWHNIVLWRGLAEIAEKYVHKGSKLYIEGKIRTRSYDDQNGVKRYVTEVWGDNLELLDKKGSDTPADIPPPPPPIEKPKAGMERKVSEQPDLESDKGDDLPF